MTSSKKKQKGIIRRGIPASPSVTIKNVEFKRGLDSRLVSTTSLSSSRSSTPLTSKAPHEPDAHADAQQLYSDVDEELLEATDKKKTKAKGASRSVSVRTVSHFFTLTFSPHPTNSHCWKNSLGMNMTMNSWMNLLGLSLPPSLRVSPTVASARHLPPRSVVLIVLRSPSFVKLAFCPFTAVSHSTISRYLA